MRKIFLFIFTIIIFTIFSVRVLGVCQEKEKSYNDFDKPAVCKRCHTDFYQQWKVAMMSQAYTHHWDEIEYFELAIPHSKKDEKMKKIEADCNGCHSPLALWAGDVPPERPAENTRADESVSCDVCHTISGFKGEIPFNYNNILSPGKIKYEPQGGLESPEHITQKNEFFSKAEFCSTCHKEKNPLGIWVKSTQLEWKERPYAK